MEGARSPTPWLWVASTASVLCPHWPHLLPGAQGLQATVTLGQTTRLHPAPPVTAQPPGPRASEGTPACLLPSL